MTEQNRNIDHGLDGDELNFAPGSVDRELNRNPSLNRSVNSTLDENVQVVVTAVQADKSLKTIHLNKDDSAALLAISKEGIDRRHVVGDRAKEAFKSIGILHPDGTTTDGKNLIPSFPIIDSQSEWDQVADSKAREQFNAMDLQADADGNLTPRGPDGLRFSDIDSHTEFEEGQGGAEFIFLKATKITDVHGDSGVICKTAEETANRDNDIEHYPRHDEARYLGEIPQSKVTALSNSEYSKRHLQLQELSVGNRAERRSKAKLQKRANKRIGASYAKRNPYTR